MADLIDRTELNEHIKSRFCKLCTKTGNRYSNGADCCACWVDIAIGLIDDAPVVDYVPAVHGKWKSERTIGGDEPLLYCSVCGAESLTEYGSSDYAYSNYCPECGAIMDGKG